MHPYTSNIPAIAQELSKMHIKPREYEQRPAHYKCAGLIFLASALCIVVAIFS